MSGERLGPTLELVRGTLATNPPHVPSESQRRAIEAIAEPLLVLAGPGAGKTFCLIERVRYLIEQLAVEPKRICAFTFTNKAAGEIAERLERTLGERAAQVKTGTIHAFCAQLLREFGARIGVERGFRIADESIQRTVLRRLGQPAQWHGARLLAFAAHRFHGQPLHRRDTHLYDRYERFLADRRLLDFDMLLLRTAELLADRQVAARIQARWDCVLVDEFQDLNRVQYAVIRDLAREHRHVFAVGDDEQSIYSWAGADPGVFLDLVNDFGVRAPLHLRENRRCPRQVLELARRLVEINTPIFTDRKELDGGRDSSFAVAALTFPTDEAEIAWIIDDLRRDREQHALVWGEFALLYRTHRIGDAVEAGFLVAGLPCRLAQGRALCEDPIVEYILAALGVIACADDIHQERFLEVVLPKPLVDDARAKAEETGRTLVAQLDRSWRELPPDHGDRKKIRRGFCDLENLDAVGRRHTSLAPLVEELLSHRVGTYRSVLEEHHDALSDPRDHAEVVHLAQRLAAALETHRAVWLPRCGGLEIALDGMLAGFGVRRVLLGGLPPEDAERVRPEDAPSLGLALAVFKAAQLVCSRNFTNAFRDFTAIDLETTDRNTRCAQIVEIGAVRVRDGMLVEEFRSLVKPRVPIAAGAQETHGICEAEVCSAPYFEEVWPSFRAFCGADLLVAHNGHQFDFLILQRMARDLPGCDGLCKYDTLPLARDLLSGSGRLEDIAPLLGIDAGASHRALNDARALARVFLALGELKVARARKTSLANLLDYLGLALVLSGDDGADSETELLRRLCRPYTLGRYSDCLEHYRWERERAEDNTLPTVQDVIERLGGQKTLERIRAERTADERYPAAMARLRRLLDQCAGETVGDQISRFLDCVALSRVDGADPDRERVNLLTLHSTKGLEFSRVYILGVEDGELPGGSAARARSKVEIEEARRLLYVGMTRTKERLVLTRVEARGGQPTGGHQFLDEMGLIPRAPE